MSYHDNTTDNDSDVQRDDYRSALDELYDTTPAWFHDEPKPYSELAPREYDNLDLVDEFGSVTERDGLQIWNRRTKPHGEEPDIVVDPELVATREEVR